MSLTHKQNGSAAQAVHPLAKNIDKVLISTDDIYKRIESLGKQISQDYAGQSLVIIGVLKGAMPFMAALIKHITVPIVIDFVAVSSYEGGTSYPRYKETYDALATALGVDVNYLRTEDEAFLEEVGQEFGSRGQRQAQAILGEARQLFAGGELSDEDKLAFLTEMQKLFLDSKQRAKKYTNKRYLRDGEDN